MKVHYASYSLYFCREYRLAFRSTKTKGQNKICYNKEQPRNWPACGYLVGDQSGARWSWEVIMSCAQIGFNPRTKQGWAQHFWICKFLDHWGEFL